MKRFLFIALAGVVLLGSGSLAQDRQIRIIALASPFSKDHWMASKSHGLEKDYTAQDILEMISELKPNCLERFITGYHDPAAPVPVRQGYPPMTVLEFLDAAILAGADDCHIVPKLNLRWLGGSGKYFWESAQALYDMPLVRPIRNINLDVWDYYCSDIHPDPRQRDEMFARLRSIGYEQIGVNMTGSKKNNPQIDYADFNIKKDVWQVSREAVDKIRSFANIKRVYLYIDYPGTMDAFRANTPDRQADIYCNTIYPNQAKMGYTFVYPIIQDSWDANASVTDPAGPYKGKTMYEITKELLFRQ